MTITDNNQKLHALWAASGLSQAEALARINRGQLRPIALSTWKAFMAGPKTARRRPCPDEVLAHAEKVMANIKKVT